jgi:hypothetical protein
MDRNKLNLFRAALRAVEVPPERAAGALRLLEGKEREVSSKGAQAVAVRQARVCEMLDCSRFHVRKLERLRLLKPVELAGLRRYVVADVMAYWAGG